MNLIDKDILTVDRGIICHQVNCQGVMGTGIAFSIKQKWPQVFEQYRNKLLMPRYKNLGRAQIVLVENELFVCNLFGQFDYGRDFRRTEYGSIYLALRNLKGAVEKFQTQKGTEIPVYVPYKISCNNAGGDWNLLMEMLDELHPNCYICKKS